MSPDHQSIDSAVLDAIDGGVVVIDRAEHIVQWNAWMASASRLSSADVRGKSLSEVFPDADLKRLSAAVRSALTVGASTTFSHSLNPSLLPLHTRAGRELLHAVTVSPVDSAAEPLCLVFVSDVTLAARREKYLRDQQNARYNAIVESAADAIITTDSEGVIQFANPAAVSQFGYALDELVGQSTIMLFDQDSGWSALWRAAIDGAQSVNSRELTALRKDGTRTYVEASAARWTMSSRVFVTVILRDVNERRALDAALRASEEHARQAAEELAQLNRTLEQRVEERSAQLMAAEQALRQSQKMEAIGQLTGGIAHDFNNLLQGIMGALHVTRRLIDAGRIGETDRFITGAYESANRAASLTHRLLAFSRQQPIDPRPLNQNQLIISVEELLRRTLGETVQMKFELAECLWLVQCDGNQLENAILNLAINARDAMPRGGELTIQTANVVLSAAESRAREVQPGEYVRLSIRDNGMGMPPEIQSRAFDPFFTTKPIGKGTGLGLSMVYGFVKQSGGATTLDSREGQGTTIEICLPRYHGELDEDSVEQERNEPPRAAANEVVLVVEDEGIVRMLVVQVLKDLGYHALEADSGAAALRILHSEQRIDLLITDLGLPDINGRELAERSVVKRKGLKVLFMTGYAERVGGGGAWQREHEVITKPFDMDALSARIRDLIER